MSTPRSREDAEQFAERLLETITFLRQEAEARRERFEAISEKDQLTRKVVGETSHSPFFSA
jgi:hypothetical protein